MARYEVLRPVEFSGTLYVPKSDDAAPKTAKSACNGADVPVNGTGVIDLDAAQAAALDLGQVKAIAAPKPKPEPKASAAEKK